MLPNTLSTIKTNILDKKLNEKKSEKLIEILKRFEPKRNRYIYPGLIIRKLGISTKETYNILNEIEKLNYIEKVYEVFCPNCKQSTGEIYTSLNDIPDETFCEECNYDFKTLEGVILIYRVIAE
ncbi:hypothetical protein CHH62_17060 [Niallia circulans]|jgi:hypothetical protein|uniref:hypothetical protein n=1 Tax=Niallia TaxID=2837506 RepID=UPI000BA56433|nr:hypothetical protein [Niallia circulans]PAD24508.1 hypothetical protein CHH62_17060 [Niallia circulans]